MVVSMAIAIRDEPEAHRKKEGDIIAVMPHGWQWGRKEVKRYLIVDVDVGAIDKMPDARKFEVPKYEADIATPPGIDEENPPAITGKRRFHIPFNVLNALAEARGVVDIDFNRVADPEDEYQPLMGVDTLQAAGLIRDKFPPDMLNENILNRMRS